MSQVDYRFCPQCQKPLSHDAKHQPVCHDCGITIYNNVVAGVSIVPVQNGRVLMAIRGIEPHKGAYDLIGGFMEPGETAEAAARREAKEETGLDIEPGEVIGHYTDQYGSDGAATFGVSFIGTITSDGQPVASDDVAELVWIDINKLPNLDLSASMKNVKDTVTDVVKRFSKSKGGL